MPRTTSRAFLAQLRSVGVDDASRGPNISDNIQLVYVVDDLSRLIAPRPPVEGYASQIVAASVINVSGISFLSPPDAATVITWMRNDSAIDTLYQVGTTFDLTADLVAGAFDFFTGPGPPRSTFQQGTKAANPSGVNLPTGENIPAKHPDIIVEPGQVFLWVGTIVNNAVTLSWSFREVPV